MAKDTLNLFALVADENNPIRRIPLSGNLQSEITDFLMGQIESFHTDQQKVDFSGSYNADEGEVFRIQDYPLDKKIIGAVENPLNLDILNLRKETHRIIALFTGIWSKESKYVGFQAFDSRKIISKGFTILNSGETYTKLEDPGITLQDKLTALFEMNEILFYSYHNTRHFVDLSEYYIEATDTDLEAFASHSSLIVDDKINFINNADSLVRKKVALLQKNRVLWKVPAKDIKTSAKQFGLEIEIKNGKKIVLPTDKKELKNLLRFLDEDYFTTVLTKRKCLTNSKEYL
jgi:hypothetical protein